MNVLTIGSSNIDLTEKVSHLPHQGETVTVTRSRRAFGGKGANQAIAAARLGGNVTFVTSLGNDAVGEEMKAHFAQEGINTNYIITDPAAPTGTAFIFVAESGENCIAVSRGANASLTSRKVTGFLEAIEACDIVVMQAEIPHETISRVARIAKNKGKKVLLNLDPAYDIDEKTISNIDILVFNDVEAAIASGIELTMENLDVVADRFLTAGVSDVIITLGSEGVYLKNCKGEFRISSNKVKVVDTVAAGDTFCGAIAVHVGNKHVTMEDLHFANAAAAISVTRAGAQPSIPTLAEVRGFMNERM